MAPSSSFRHDVAEWVFGLPVAAASGFTFDKLADGRSVTRLTWRPRHSHTPGAFQASPIASLADFTGASAGMTLLPVGGVGGTMDYTVKFLAEARGDELVARGHVLRPGPHHHRRPRRRLRRVRPHRSPVRRGARHHPEQRQRAPAGLNTSAAGTAPLGLFRVATCVSCPLGRGLE
jgi:acyl-coenzyme A thioesterase PaaI-like protein